MWPDFKRAIQALRRMPRSLRHQLRGAILALVRGKEYIDGLESRIQEMTSTISESDQRILFTLVGQALSTWAKMEETIVLTAAMLLGVNSEKAGLVMYSIINFQAWLNLIDDLFSVEPLFAPVKPKWNKISTRLIDQYESI